MEIIQIVPRLHPSIDGVGDYALCLARQLRDHYGVNTHFVVCDPVWIGKSDIEDFHVCKTKKRDGRQFANVLAAIMQQVAPTSVLLHYVGYGYAKRGCPVWLADGLQLMKRNFPSLVLITMFHELLGPIKVFSSSFVLRPLQRQVIRVILGSSDGIATTLTQHKKTLNDMKSMYKGPIVTVPVFSNVGEAADIAPWHVREPAMVVFGRRRQRLYRKKIRSMLSLICERLKLKKIYDIGPDFDRMPVKVGKTPVIHLGIRAAEEISKLLNSVSVGFLDYRSDLLAKSGVFAAYCSHGVLPVVSEFTGDKDGLREGTHYLSSSRLSDFQVDPQKLPLISQAASRWYQTHSLTKQAEILRSLIQPEYLW